MRRIKRDIVGAVLISADNKVLLDRTDLKAGGVYSGCWVIPGGGVDDGETLEEVLIREVKEETHLDIQNEIIELQWVSMDDLKNVELSPPAKALFCKMRKL